VELDQTVYALDSTTIDLCLSLFPWAKFRKHKGAVKLHTLLNLHGSIPSVVIITHGKIHDVNILDDLIMETGAIYIMDRGYLDFARLYTIQQSLAFFVTRTKSNFSFKRLYSQTVDRSTGGSMRPNYCARWLLRKKRLSRETATNSLFRRQEQQTIGLLNKQLRSSGINPCRTLSLPLARRVIFQMDQAALTDQSFLWHDRKCRQDPNLDHDLRLCVGRYRQKTSELGSESLHNSTDFECDSFRKNAHFTGFLRH
jgi:hypothetical protein